MYSAEYWTDSGLLQREGPVTLSPADGCTVKTYPDAFVREGKEWNPATRDFEAPVSSARTPMMVMDRGEFVKDRLGYPLLAAAFALNDPRIEAFRFVLDSLPTVSLDDPLTVGGVSLLRSLSLITAEQAASILAPKMV